MINLTVKISFCLAICLVSVGCKKSDDSLCNQMNPFKVNMQVYGHRAGELIYIDGNEKYLTSNDTVLAGDVMFQTTTEAKHYQWIVGNDRRTWLTQSFILNFTNNDIGTIPVQLVAKGGNTNQQCFPGDDGIDTIYKNIVVVPDSVSPLFGKYEGVLEDEPNNKFVVEIYKNIPNPPYHSKNNAEIRNLPNGYQSDFPSLTLSYMHFSAFGIGLNTQCNCGAYIIEGFLSANHKQITITYTDINTSKKRVFKGYKFY